MKHSLDESQKKIRQFTDWDWEDMAEEVVNKLEDEKNPDANDQIAEDLRRELTRIMRERRPKTKQQKFGEIKWEAKE